MNIIKSNCFRKKKTKNSPMDGMLPRRPTGAAVSAEARDDCAERDDNNDDLTAGATTMCD